MKNQLNLKELNDTLKNISDEQLSLLVQKARNLGMPEKYIQDALAFIKSLKNN